MNDNLLLETCPNGCTGELNRTFLDVAEGPLRKCAGCGVLISSCTQKQYERSSEDWNTEEGTWPSKKNMVRLKKRRRKSLHLITNLLDGKSDIRLLDVGCSNGAFVSIAKDFGIHAEGVDPSAKAVKNGIDRGLNIHIGYLQDISFHANTFDAITLYEVLEHVNEPKALLKECHRILKPDGILLIGTGNTNSWTRAIQKSKWDFFDMNRHGGHIVFFSPKSLATLAAKTGFAIKKVKTASVTFYEKGDVPHLIYRITKIFAELINIPSQIVNRGHQMEVYLAADKNKNRG